MNKDEKSVVEAERKAKNDLVGSSAPAADFWLFCGPHCNPHLMLTFDDRLLGQKKLFLGFLMVD
jgi:hypothetical protein